MLVTIFQIFSFVSENVIWILFSAILLWIVFAPQLKHLFNHGQKSQRYFVE